MSLGGFSQHREYASADFNHYFEMTKICYGRGDDRERAFNYNLNPLRARLASLIEAQMKRDLFDLCLTDFGNS